MKRFAGAVFMALAMLGGVSWAKPATDPVADTIGMLALVKSDGSDWIKMRAMLMHVRWKSLSPKPMTNPTYGFTHVMDGGISTPSGVYSVSATGTINKVMEVELFGPEGERKTDRTAAIRAGGVNVIRVKCADNMQTLDRVSVGKSSVLLRTLYSSGIQTSGSYEYDVDFTGRALTAYEWNGLCPK